MGAVQLACSTLTFNHLPLEDALGHISKLGFDIADLAAFDDREFGHVQPAEVSANLLEVTTGLLKAAERTGVQYGAVNAGCDTLDQAEELRRVMALCLMAHRIGARVITLPAGRGSVEDAVSRLAPQVEIGQRYGIAIAVETHLGNIAERPEGALELVRRIPGLKLTLDPSHYLVQGDSCQTWVDAMPYVAHVHLRDAGRGGRDELQVPWGEGALNLEDLLRALDEVDYSGLLSVEYLRPKQFAVRPHDPVEQIVKLKEALGSALSG